MLFSKAKFRGGIHPKDHKEISRSAEIIPAQTGDEVVIPLSQHIGGPCTPTIEKEDTVSLGDTIGSPSGFISSIIHSSVSGIVKDITRHPHPMGRKLLSVSIKVGEGQEKTYPRLKDDKAAMGLSSKEIRDLVQKAGIVGMGGASFPTHVKLSPPKGKIITTLIINAAECEPYLTADETLIRNFSSDVILGAKLLQKAASAKRLIIAMEDNKPEALEKLKSALSTISDIELSLLPTQYPQGGEKQLVEAVLGKEVPSGGLPMDAETLVQNVSTAFAVFEAVVCEKPLIERIVSVTGYGIEKPGNYKVKIGTKLKNLLEQAGFKESDSSLVIMGGPMMGLPIIDLDTPIIKSTSGVLVFDKQIVKKEFPCIRCARCIENCPISLAPTELASAYRRGDLKAVEERKAMDCIECGCCAFICPSGIPLVQYIKLAKLDLRKNARK